MQHDNQKQHKHPFLLNNIQSQTKEGKKETALSFKLTAHQKYIMVWYSLEQRAGKYSIHLPTTVPHLAPYDLRGELSAEEPWDLGARDVLADRSFLKLSVSSMKEDRCSLT